MLMVSLCAALGDVLCVFDSGCESTCSHTLASKENYVAEWEPYDAWQGKKGLLARHSTINEMGRLIASTREHGNSAESRVRWCSHLMCVCRARGIGQLEVTTVQTQCRVRPLQCLT